MHYRVVVVGEAQRINFLAGELIEIVLLPWNSDLGILVVNLAVYLKAHIIGVTSTKKKKPRDDITLKSLSDTRCLEKQLQYQRKYHLTLQLLGSGLLRVREVREREKSGNPFSQGEVSALALFFGKCHFLCIFIP